MKMLSGDGISVFVAGHTGLIGSAFVRRLKAEGFENLHLRSHCELDLLHAAKVEDFFSRVRPELVLFCAGRSGGIGAQQRRPADYLADNLQMSLNCIRAARAYDVRRFLFLGSSCMYPKECAQPMREEALLAGRPESTSLGYALSKLAGLYLCQAYNEQDDRQRFLTVIAGGVYGPGDDFDLETSHVLPALIRRFHSAKKDGIGRVVLWGTGTVRRELLYVDDLVDACLFLLGQERLGELPINIGSGSDYSIESLARLVARTVGYEGRIEFDPMQPDGAPRKLLDRSRLRLLGWEKGTPLEAGLRMTYDWYQEARKCL